MKLCKPYTTTVLEKIRDKSDDLEMWELEDAIRSLSGNVKSILSYIVERNTNGCLPRVRDMAKSKYIKVTRSTLDRNIKKLLENRMIINPSSVEILQVFGYKGGSIWKIFPDIAEKDKSLKGIGGYSGSMLSWSKKYESSRAPVYERYYQRIPHALA